MYLSVSYGILLSPSVREGTSDEFEAREAAGAACGGIRLAVRRKYGSRVGRDRCGGRAGIERRKGVVASDRLGDYLCRVILERFERGFVKNSALKPDRPQLQEGRHEILVGGAYARIERLRRKKRRGWGRTGAGEPPPGDSPAGHP